MSQRCASFVFALGGLIIGCTPEGGSRGEGQVEVAAVVTTTAFQDGVAPTASYFGTRDTMLEQDSPSTNHGFDTKLSVSGDTPAGSGRDDEALLQWT